MKLTLQLKKWGNSVGLRIPTQVLDSLEMSENVEVTLEVKGDRIIVKKSNSLPDLDEILDSIPEDFTYPEDVNEFIDSKPLGEELI